LGNVRTLADQDRILEKIIGSTVLLEDHDHMVNLSGRRWGRWRTAAGAATAVETQESAPDSQDQNCKKEGAKLGHFSSSPSREVLIVTDNPAVRTSTWIAGRHPETGSLYASVGCGHAQY
jgi:hypothetical protein